ncbi:hypothetical protein TcasGA2_TC012791 [Tribolium castaneum]|uniref:Uncharacterized protein n=1 Tax=Tribolium castaneum TaxID=7070 RepID=D6X0F5_TRICA|nr:hypothetical protein TcasGA2_TC012791 [Tribolium castaneum]
MPMKLQLATAQGPFYRIVALGLDNWRLDKSRGFTIFPSCSYVKGVIEKRKNRGQPEYKTLQNGIGLKAISRKKNFNFQTPITAKLKELEENGLFHRKEHIKIYKIE